MNPIVLKTAIKNGKSAFSSASNTVSSPKNRTALKIAGVLVGAYILYRIINSAVKSAPSQQEVQDAYTELEKLNQSAKTKQKISNFQAKSYANSVHTAMDGYGTNEEAIKQIFYKLQNDADFLALSKSYGVREISSGKFNPEPNFKGTFSSALKNEVDDVWIKIYNKILRDKKIKYQL
jgi:hypothetical protein